MHATPGGNCDMPVNRLGICGLDARRPGLVEVQYSDIEFDGNTGGRWPTLNSAVGVTNLRRSDTCQDAGLGGIAKTERVEIGASFWCDRRDWIGRVPPASFTAGGHGNAKRAGMASRS